MKVQLKKALNWAMLCMAGVAAYGFEGRIEASLLQGDRVETYTYTVGSNMLHIARNETNRPYARNLVALDTGAVTLVFPHNRSFMQLKERGAPDLRPGSAAGVRVRMPAQAEATELKTAGAVTNLLGCACVRYEIKQRTETMEIWATDQLLPFHVWLPCQPPRFGPRTLEERWGELLREKGLFPLHAVLKTVNGTERMRFAVKSVMPKKTEASEGALFQPPPGYHELQPLCY